MPIKDNTNWRRMDANATAFNRRVSEVLVRTAEYLGAEFVADARETGTYADRTGNLRSSVQAAVSTGGVKGWNSNAGIVKGGSEGCNAGIEMASDIASQAKDGIIRMAGVAAMPYAVYVEAKGFEVISSAALRAEAKLPRLLKESFSETGLTI